MPIYNAITVLRFAVAAALTPLTSAGVYWLRADQDVPLPYVIFQSQDLGGKAVERVGELSWEGLVTVRALASDQGAADTLMGAIVGGMATLSYAGHTITARYVRPIVIPPDGDTWQSAHQWRVHIGV
jgi:hypothetical protein